MLGVIVFWTFQVINLLTALGMFLAPRRFHESMFKGPEEAYRILGFPKTAVEMLHNVLRGQGAALLAISMFLFYLRPSHPGSFLLIALTCGLSLLAHLFTTVHHKKSALVMAALGDIKAMYIILLINLIVGTIAAVVFLGSMPTTMRYW